MKIRLEETHPGELQDRAEDVVRVLEQLAGRDLLKAVDPEDQIRQSPAQYEYPAVAGAVLRARRQVDRIRAIMDRKIAAVLGG